jgi:DNA helicase-2/ATP-dependent DNA helicase PcrA
VEQNYQLNPEQQKVVTITEGPVLVLAGAGSGKTRCVIFRALYLLKEKKIRPWNLLIVTFTNKAANELKHRLNQIINIPENQLWIGTFHSICTRILRYEIDFIPYQPNFTIYDADDQASVLKKIYKQLDIDSKHFNLNKVRNIISHCKNSLIHLDDFFLYHEENYYTTTVERIYRKYQEVLLQNNALDFDDLLLRTVLLFEKNESVRQKYAEKFEYIMIDEYQDTNYAQFKIIHSLAKERQNICVVGDDDQAIYSWRGATIKNILNFEKDYKKVTTIKLEHNYRSQQAVLDLANSLITNNMERHPKELWSTIPAKSLPTLQVFYNEKEEAQNIALQILDIKNQSDVSFNHIAVLYRTNAQSRSFELAFQQKRIPYQIIGGIHFYQRKEIKDILAYLRLLVNPADNESFLRIINFPTRGIGKVTIDKINEYAVLHELSLLEATHYAAQFLSKSASEKTRAFLQMYKKWRQISKEEGINELVRAVLEDTKMAMLYESSDDSQDIARTENIGEFVSAVQEFVSDYEAENAPDLSDFLQNLSLQTDIDNFKEHEHSVKLMTMHNAKGLEFEYVFIIGLSDDLVPHTLTHENENSIQEERRLLYVAITRAKTGLFLSYSKDHSFFYKKFDPSYEEVFFPPSRFIAEFDESNISKVETDKQHFYEERFKPQTKILESKKHYFIGQKISHDKFGKGIILNVEGSGIDAKLTISFENGTLKKIIGNYVKK